MKKILLIVLSLLIICLNGCGTNDDVSGKNDLNEDYPAVDDAGENYPANGDDMMADVGMAPDAEFDSNEEYTEIVEGGFISPSTKPLSSFSLDSSSYAYANLRRLIKNNYKVYSDAVNIEQMLNYFDYSYENDTDNALSSTIEIAECPWNSENHLALISVNSKDVEILDSKNNFVFLIDVSGSMNVENKIGLFKESFRLFMDNIGEDDTVSIVTYASGVRVIADGINGNEKMQLIEAVEELNASGSTNGSGGIQKAYELAQKHFIEDGNNRVLIATDGDFNVGIKNQNDLNEFISDKRQTGVYLSIFGYGVGNTKHNTMETLATNGNGNAYYIDSILEAKKVFVSEMGSVLNTVAKDCKIQVEFNPNVVEKYRLIGYENKRLTDDEFEDSNTDAGEIGASHTTIAMYEICLKENMNDEFILKTKLRYKDTQKDELEVEVVNEVYEVVIPSNDFMFASCVVEFGLILRESDFKGNSSFEHLITLLEQVEFNDVYKEEFKELVLLAYQNQMLNEW